jgi:hypothetical protein
MASLGYGYLSYEIVRENRVEFVLKNWKTHRTITPEPEGAMPFQLAFDGFVKDRLLRIGVDLCDQSRNQEYARLGSIHDTYVTVDLEQASDTNSYNTVGWLTPWRWWQYLCAVRSPSGVVNGDRVEYAKFSSMGNGVTFGLESLIFASLCKAVVDDGDFCVYGDDIIVPKDAYPRLLRLLRFFGFKVNQEKTFVNGPFRESCGEDWFAGVNITPFYLRCEQDLRVELIHIVNGLAAIALPSGRLARYLRNIVDTENLPLVPWNESSISGVWVDPHTAWTLQLVKNYGFASKQRKSAALVKQERRSNDGLDCSSEDFVPSDACPTRGEMRGIWEPSGRLIHNQGWCPSFKGFISLARTHIVDDSRTLALWHLDAGRRKAGLKIHSTNYILSKGYYNTPSDWNIVPSCISRSSVPHLTPKYKRKWVSWFIPATVTPVHLFWWSDFITPRKGGVKVRA